MRKPSAVRPCLRLPCRPSYVFFSPRGKVVIGLKKKSATPNFFWIRVSEISSSRSRASHIRPHPPSFRLESLTDPCAEICSESPQAVFKKLLYPKASLVIPQSNFATGATRQGVAVPCSRLAYNFLLLHATPTPPFLLLLLLLLLLSPTPRPKTPPSPSRVASRDPSQGPRWGHGRSILGAPKRERVDERA